ncbi:hypothetical protein CEQ90_03090 [Lewinellaceae bacterium SD302]|nr:hypothetical protein CEQ90_03090 [Lewinellaceae bacterium SD302]
MKFKPGRRNLIAVLDWGLGHASRSLALATRLETAGEIVDFASTGPALLMLKRERPLAKIHPLPAYDVGYQSSNMVVNIGRQLPGILRTVQQEHKALAEILRQEAYERIISDSRFGCYARNIDCVMLTHQLHPIFGSPLAAKIYRWFLTRNFSEFWVPDHPGLPRMSGVLSDSRGYPVVNYIGPLSRLQKPLKIGPELHYDLVALLSGPEPQRTYLEDIIFQALQTGSGRYLIVAGRPDKVYDQPVVLTKDGGSIERIAYSNAQQTAAYLTGAKRIICRSGYSTLMDLASLEVEARIILVPTPGQTEQEYLAKQWSAASSNKIISAPQTSLATLASLIVAE